MTDSAPITRSTVTVDTSVLDFDLHVLTRVLRRQGFRWVSGNRTWAGPTLRLSEINPTDAAILRRAKPALTITRTTTEED
jgi:hypothetical protein